MFTIILSDIIAQNVENITVSVDDVDIEYEMNVDGVTNDTVLEFMFEHTGEMQIISIFFDTPLDLSSIPGYSSIIILISFIGIVWILIKRSSNR